MKIRKVVFAFDNAMIEYTPAQKRGEYFYMVIDQAGRRLERGTMTGRQSCNPTTAARVVAKVLAEKAPREGVEWM